MDYDREHDIVSGRLSLDDISEYDAMGYDAAPRAGYYRYKMTARPFSLGCQPKDGLISYEESHGFKTASGYYGIVTYDRQLTDEEVRRFELTEVG